MGGAQPGARWAVPSPVRAAASSTEASSTAAPACSAMATGSSANP